MKYPSLILRPGRDRSVLQRHPWVYASAIDSLGGKPEAGETVFIRNSSGEPLALAAYSPISQIRARIWTWDTEASIDRDFLTQRLQQAIDLRTQVIPAGATTAMRLVHGESDGLPGLIVDRYNDTLVLQVLTAGMEALKPLLVELLQSLTGCTRVLERSDVDVRELEGLEPTKGILAGEPIVEPLVIEENGLKFRVDLEGGQKTGFFVDQRDNRQLLRQMVQGKSVLNCFCYTGAFSVYAFAGGATSVLSMDSSEPAMSEVQHNLELNGFGACDSELMSADVFTALRKFRDSRRSFDVIILDPPKFAPTYAQAEKAARGYKDINLLAFKLLNPGGLLFTFSCSGGVSRDLFQKIVAGAALDAGVDAKIVAQLSQAGDHPIALNFPEGQYLKGLVCKI
ncbi:MAG: class I SAM-dependent rRNA methyltransferase [Anaerolineaceae bacterium]|nr:class I SAM-dependent rRNA methyltransferase [Anaerolineaceae bacterium]